MKYSHRIFYYFLKDDVLFYRILEYIQNNKEGIDEIALIFDESCSAYQTPEKLEEETHICKKRLQQLRDVGVKSVGINMLATIGHKSEAWSWNPMPPFQTVVSPYGKLSFGQLCPRNEAAQEYIRRKYRAAIAAEPDFLWVDDDLRVVHHEDGNMACFCDQCVQRFNQIADTRYRRVSLVEALKNPSNKLLRKQWLHYNLDSYKNICSIVNDEVRKSGKNIKLGLMTVHLEQNTKFLCDVNELANSLGATMVRPGGGFYWDYNLLGMIYKICGVAYQNAMMSNISERMYELEDFPATVPRKSVRTHITESTLAIMAGCDGIMTNSMPPCKGTTLIYKALEKQRSCHEIIAKRMRETRLVGARPAFSTEIDIHIRNTDFFHSQNHAWDAAEEIINKENTFSFAGFVPYTDPLYEEAWVTFLSGEMARAIDDEKLKTMLSRGVLMDGDAAAILCERGYSDLIGCMPGTCYDNGLAEFYTSHPLNGEAALERRDTRMTYENSCTAMCLIPSEGAEALTNMVSITGEKLGVASVAFENRLGGRCVVMGYDPWRFPNMWHREHQLHNIFDWLWNGHAPYTGINAPGIFQLYRENAGKTKFMLMLTNLWEDESGEIIINFANEFTDNICLYRGRGQFDIISEKNTWVADGRRFVRIPSMESHTFVVIMND